MVWSTQRELSMSSSTLLSGDLKAGIEKGESMMKQSQRVLGTGVL